MRVAWFSPLPPSRSGIAAYSAEVLPLLRDRGYAIDTFVASSAHEFVWKHRRRPYDLTVYQMGNAACHDYMWSYLFRYPGLVVLHDAQLHQARALALTTRWLPRRDDYLAEFRANHPDAPAEIGEVVAAGFGESLFAHWPHIRLVLAAARLTVVHNRRLLSDLREEYSTAMLDAIPMGVADPTSPGRSIDVRRRHGIPPDTVVLAAYGGLTPEKRIGSLLRALSTTAARFPRLHALLVGQSAEHYDVAGAARQWGVAERVHITGYVPEAELPAYLHEADLAACLRWPTNRETSASWLRCLAAGRATLVSDLADLVDVPMVEPRGWQTLDTSHPHREPVAVSITVVDEDRALHLALERLVGDREARERLGRAARAWWLTHHQLVTMADAYDGVMRAAMALPVPAVELPAHLLGDASAHGRALVDAFGVGERASDVFP